MGKKEVIYIDNPIDEDGRKEAEKLEAIVKESEVPIYELGSIFPYKLFPDKIIIDKNKVTIVRKELFFRRVFPLLIEDIRTVKINRGILFATMEFEVIGYEENPNPVTMLHPQKALTAQKYIVGLVRAKRENIDLSNLNNTFIKQKLEEISRSEQQVSNIF